MLGPHTSSLWGCGLGSFIRLQSAENAAGAGMSEGTSMDSVGEGEGGKIWENGIETCKISCM